MKKKRLGMSSAGKKVSVISQLGMKDKSDAVRSTGCWFGHITLTLHLIRLPCTGTAFQHLQCSVCLSTFNNSSIANMLPSKLGLSSARTLIKEGEALEKPGPHHRLLSTSLPSANVKATAKKSALPPARIKQTQRQANNLALLSIKDG